MNKEWKADNEHFLEFTTDYETRAVRWHFFTRNNNTSLIVAVTMKKYNSMHAVSYFYGLAHNI